VFKAIRGWWDQRKQRKIAKDAEDHAHLDPAELERLRGRLALGRRGRGGR
jgi:hypothetical protein